MTENQVALRNYLASVSERHGHDVMSAIMSLHDHISDMPWTVHIAYRKLTAEEKNMVVKELCMVQGG